jgi:hypothetical protein
MPFRFFINKKGLLFLGFFRGKKRRQKKEASPSINTPGGRAGVEKNFFGKKKMPSKKVSEPD